MSDLIRDAPLGQIIRWVTKNRVLQYPEEREDFELPSTYLNPTQSHTESTANIPKGDHPPLPNVDTALEKGSQSGSQDTADINQEVEKDEEYDLEKIKTAKDLELEGQKRNDMEKIQTARDEKGLEAMQPTKSSKTNRTAKSHQTTKSAKSIERIPTQTALAQIHTQQDLEQQLSNASLPRQPTQQIVPEQLDDGTILVTWYDTDDPSNPQNWGFGKKLFVLTLIW